MSQVIEPSHPHPLLQYARTLHSTREDEYAHAPAASHGPAVPSETHTAHAATSVATQSFCVNRPVGQSLHAAAFAAEYVLTIPGEQFGQDMPHPLPHLEDADGLLFGRRRVLCHRGSASGLESPLLLRHLEHFAHVLKGIPNIKDVSVSVCCCLFLCRKAEVRNKRARRCRWTLQFLPEREMQVR